MTTLALNRPEAEDIDALSITPTRTFEICNALLNDSAAMEKFYEDNGYLFFRDVLDPQSVVEAREAMLAIASDHFGLIAKGDPEAHWTGKGHVEWNEEDPVFSGISMRLVGHPANQALLAKILGQPACMVPMVSYRLYPPNGPVTMIHQDGFYSPGIVDYKPLWIPLAPCPREVGGLMIAVGQHKKGFLHNIGKGQPFPIAADAVDRDSWTTMDYLPGDLLVVHPRTPHGGTPNRSDRLRITLDTRVQSAANPSAFAATVTSVTPTSITVKAQDDGIGTVTLSVDEETYIRVRNRGKREEFAHFVEYTVPGMHLVVVRDGGRATMLRQGAHP